MRLSEFQCGTLVTCMSAVNDHCLLVASTTRLEALLGIQIGNGTTEYAMKIELCPSSTLPSPITCISTLAYGSRVALMGNNFVCILSLPADLWVGSVSPEFLQSRYFCESFLVQESVFLGAVSPLEVEWTTIGNEEESIVLAILSDDSALRFYEIDSQLGVNYPRSKLDFVHSLVLHSQTRGNSYGLFKSIVSFSIVSSVHNGWHIIVCDSEGEAYASFASLCDPSLNLTHSLDLPLEISMLRRISHDSEDVFKSFIAVSPNGMVSHLICLSCESSIDAVRIADSISLEGIYQVVPVRGGALVQSPSATIFLDMSSSFTYLTTLLIGNDEIEWCGMNVIDCIAAPTCTILPSVPPISLNVQGPIARSIVLSISGDAIHSTLIHHAKPTTKSTENISRRTNRYTKSLEEKVKKLLNQKEGKAKVIISRSSKESDMLKNLVHSIAEASCNVELLRNAVHLVSQCIVMWMGRIDAMDRGEKEENSRILRLYDDLQVTEDRIIKQRIRTETLTKRATFVWNSLGDRLGCNMKEIEMHNQLKEHKKNFSEMGIQMAKTKLEIEMDKRELDRRTECNLASIKNANLAQIRDEVEFIRHRCDLLEKSVV